MADICSLKIRRLANGDWVRLKCMRATAVHHGWLQALDPEQWAEMQQAGEPGIAPLALVRRTKANGGKRLRICSSPRKQGHPAGMTNCFRLTWGFNNLDLALLAQLSSAEWSWMETRTHQRRDRSWWMQQALRPSDQIAFAKFLP